MLILLACLAHPPSLVDEWSVLAPPALCRSTPNPVEPSLLASGAHLEPAHADARFDDEPHAPALAYTSFLQMIEEDARLASTRLEVQQWLPAHVTGATEEGWSQSFEKLEAMLEEVG